MKMRTQTTLRLAFCALAAATLPSAMFGSCGPDLNTEFRVQLGRQYRTNDGLVHQTANITNIGPNVKGPYYFVIENLPAGVGESPFTWTAGCEPGALFIRVYLGFDNQWANNATKTLMLNFGNASMPLNYSYKVISGANLPNPRVVPGDYDGDRIADLAMYNPTTGNWTIKQSSNQLVTTKQYGIPNLDHFVVGDFDGDLKEDVAVYRPSTGMWFFTRSSDGVQMGFQLGVPNVDIPVPADYDGDGYTDMAVFNKNTGVYTVRQSTNGQVISKQFGLAGDIPVPADYDGDGRADFAVFRPALHAFYILKSFQNQVYSLSDPGFKNGLPFAADIDGDGRADMCAYNSNTGIVTIAYSGTINGPNITANTVSMGSKSLPVVADFSGDNQADMATYDAPSGYWALDSQMTSPVPVPVLSFAFGTPPSDIPVMAIPAAIW